MSKFSVTRFVVCLLILVLGMFATQALAQSQASSGQIAGTVKDSAGAVIVGATVKATNPATGFSQTTTTGDGGFYRVVLLPPGNYKVTVSQQGFAEAAAQVEVGVGRTLDVNFSLVVGGRQEVVTVTGEGAEVTRHEYSAFVNSTLVSQLPLNGGRFHDIALMTPTVQFDQSRGGINISGQREINGSAIVDGTSYDNPFFGGLRGGERAGFAPTMPLDAIQEFQVVRAGYAPEFGRSTGGVITAVTKSGTNSYHGNGNFFVRPQGAAGDNGYYSAVRASLAANPFPVVPAPTQLQWGGSFGGPIKKDKLFFFGAYTQQRFRQDRTVLYSNLTNVTLAPANPTIAEAYNYYLTLQQPFKATNDAKAGMGKVDWNLSNKHRLSVKYNRSTNEAANSVSTGTSPNPVTNSAISNNGSELDATHTVVGNLASFFGGLTNDLRGEYSIEHRPRPANALAPLVSNTFGQYGTRNFLGQNLEYDYRIQFADSLTWQKGKHTIKFGGEYNHLYANQIFGFNQFGSINFGTTNANTVLQLMSATATNNAAFPNRYDSTLVTYMHQIGNLKATLSGELPAAFVQDSWRVFPTLTLSFGLRWEGQTFPQPDASNTALVNLIGNQTWPLSAGGVVPARENPTSFPNAMKQFSPRLGFAWDPKGDGKTVIRGFGGTYYAASPLLLFAGPSNNFRATPGDLSIQLPLKPLAGSACPTCTTVYQQLLLAGIDMNTKAVGSEPIVTNAQLATIGSKLGYSDLTTLGTQPLMMDNNFKNPRSYQAGFGFEREFFPHWTAGAEFTWIKTVYLQRNMELNLPMPTGLCATPQTSQACINPLSGRPQYGLTLSSPPGAVARPVSTLGSVQARVANAKALYRGLVVRTAYNSKRFQMNAYYTLSENLANDDQERNAGGISYSDASSQALFAKEYNFSSQDRRHQFVAAPVFFAPWGLEFAGALRFLSGVPAYSTASSALLDVDIGTDSGVGNQDRTSGNDRPYSAFGVPFHRNQFRQPGQKFIDFRVQKSIKVGEGKNIVSSVDFFNIANWMNMQFAGTQLNYCGGSGPSATATCGFAAPTNPNFLQLRDQTKAALPFLTANTPGPVRQIQFAFKFVF